MERLQKVIAQAGVSSRRKAEALIKDGKVKVNGVVVSTLGVKVDPKKDEIVVNGKPIVLEDKVYFLLNKPNGYLSTVSDKLNRPTVLDLLTKEDRKYRVYPVGRLDFHSQGLIILTNDGALTYHLTHPKFQVEKEYQVRVSGFVGKLDLLELKKGIKIDGEILKAKYARILEVDKGSKSTLLKVVLTEGKNHEVRLMMEALGYPVKTLTRTRYAFLTTKDVGRGYYRPLKVHEVKKLFLL